MKTVMNNLNSVLLEGTVPGKIDLVEEAGKERCFFVVSSLRYVKNGKNIEERETRVPVMLRDPQLVRSAVANARDGRGVRVVGRLAVLEEDNGLCIEVEHIEYRPEKKGGAE